MDKFEFIKNAMDSNAFQATTASAAYVNPDIWSYKLLDHEKSQLVAVQFGRVYNDILNAPGETLTVAIDAEPTSASALTESSAVTIDALSFTKVTFTPSEYGAAYQVTDKEMRRPFFDLMSNITQKLGYRLAKKKDSIVVALLQASAGNTVVANSVASSAIASSDTMDYDDIVNLKIALKKDKYEPKVFLIGVEQEGQIMKLSDFKAAYAFGAANVVQNGTLLGGTPKGFLGRAVGLDIYSTTQIAATDSKAKAIMLGTNDTGEEAFGICNKANPKIATERHELERTTDFVAVEEYDVQVLHANGIGTLETYAA